MTDAIARWLKSRAAFPVGVGTAAAHRALENEAERADYDAIPSSFAPPRRQTFLLGRLAARRALVDAGSQPVHLPRSAEGPPVWPAGLAGSLAHTDTLALAVVCRRRDALGIGVDLEPIGREMPHAVFERILLPAERGTAMHRTGLADRVIARSVFCAKEAAFKAHAGQLTPTVGFWHVALQPITDGLYRAVIHGSGLPPCKVDTRCVGEHVVAFAWAPA